MIVVTAALCGCNTSKPTVGEETETPGTETVKPGTELIVPEPEVVVPKDGATVSMLPKAVIYKMNGPWADYVPVSVSADGKQLVSFPAPSDLTDESTPLPMADGYYLDRRGVSANTRFINYTYQQYRSLAHTPSPSELLGSIIPDARVIDLHYLPITASEAIADTAAVNILIHNL